MIGYFLIALTLFIVVTFIVILKKRTKNLSEIESAEEDDSIMSDSLPIMASEVIIDDDPIIPDAVDLTSDLPPPDDQGDLGADTSMAVCSALDYLANVADTPDPAPEPTPAPDPIDNSSSRYESNSYSDYGSSSSDYGSSSNDSCSSSGGD